MPASMPANDMVAFLSDLRLVASVGALALYGAWAAWPSTGLVSLARLGLVVAFGSTVLTYAVAPVPPIAPYLDLFLFALLAAFLLLEFLFQMSVLGIGVSLVAVLITGARYVPGLPLPVEVVPAPNAVVAYWGVWRDLVATAGGAALFLGLGAGTLLRLAPDRRGGKLVHPNDLRDATAMLARIAAPAFMLALVAGGLALARNPVAGIPDYMKVATLGALVVGSLAWLVQAEGRNWDRGIVLPLVAWNLLALAVLVAGEPVVLHLTRPAAGP